MALRNTSDSFGSLTKWFHWANATLIFGMLTIGTIFTTLLEKGPLKNQLVIIHKSIGLCLLLLIIVSWFWRRANPRPKMLSISNRFSIAVRSFHELLYISIFFMLLSGILLTAAKHYTLPFFGLFEIPTTWFPRSKPWHEFFATVHLVTAWILTTFIVIHISAALKHHFCNKDETLKRMMPKP